MNDVSHVFMLAVATAFFAGFAVSLIALGYWYSGFQSRALELNDDSQQRVQYWRDACGIIFLSLFLQLAILVMPVFYKSPDLVPRSLAEAAIMATAALAVFWVWALWCLHRAGGTVAWRKMTRGTIFIWSAPMLCSIAVVPFTL